MRTKEFQKFLSKVATLTPNQEKELKSVIKKQSSVKIVENAFNTLGSCPHCKSIELYKWGINAGIQRYKCKSCNKTFNGLTNTPLARLRKKEKWNQFSKDLVLSKSISSCAKDNNIANSTSFRWRHRFLQTISDIKSKHLHGIVEVDETFFLESSKGDHHLERKARKRGSKATKRGLSSQQIPVLISRDRNGNMSDFVLENANEKALIKALLPILDKDILLCSDGNNIYKAFAKHFNFEHKPVNISAGKHTNGTYHIQNVNSYDSRMKTWFKRFHGIATKYLKNYLGWIRMLDMNKNITAENVLKMAMLRI